MNFKIFLHCFFLLTAVALASFLGEFLVRPLINQPAVKAHAFFPVVSFPLMMKALAQPETPGAKIKTQPQKVRLLLKNGKTASGILLSDAEGWIQMDIDGDTVGFHRSEIKKIETDLPERP